MRDDHAPQELGDEGGFAGTGGRLNKNGSTAGQVQRASQLAFQPIEFLFPPDKFHYDSR
jgi:hypothetical protein